MFISSFSLAGKEILVGRPPKPRTVAATPAVSLFKPQGVPARYLDTVVLGLDELEALRLADREGLYQEEAAERMGISRPTFGRLVEEARRKVADALFNGRALAFEGGAVACAGQDIPRCGRCGRRRRGDGDQAGCCGVCAAETDQPVTQGGRGRGHCHRQCGGNDPRGA